MHANEIRSDPNLAGWHAGFAIGNYIKRPRNGLNNTFNVMLILWALRIRV